ncbi:leucine-rich repeat isoform f [Anaeramoeba flamelloides]|uniref:Leucine-rich repeat isoform f n=1 Tax=Anaeramoeba flamelloides TaxID=1746091 RepID=A0AAV7YRI7_9EUKA|nr:leucine-rich repeat isoform f [Anaeramoeba flamelloides]
MANTKKEFPIIKDYNKLQTTQDQSYVYTDKRTKKKDFDWQILNLQPLTIKQKVKIESLVRGVTNDKIVFSSNIIKKNARRREKRIIVLTDYRIITIGKRRNSIKNRICRNGHLYDLKRVEYQSDVHIKFIFQNFQLNAFMKETEALFEILQTKLELITKNFLQYEKPSIYNLKENDSMVNILQKIRSIERKQTKTNKSLDYEFVNLNYDYFQQFYKSWCSYYDTPVNPRFNRYLTNSTTAKSQSTVFDLCRYSQLDTTGEPKHNDENDHSNLTNQNNQKNQSNIKNKSKSKSKRKRKSNKQTTVHYRPIINSLKNNNFFTDLNFQNCNLKSNYRRLIKILGTTTKVESLNLSNINVNERHDKLGKLFLANNIFQARLQHLDLSNNRLNCKNEATFARGLGEMTNLTKLNLSSTSMNSNLLNSVLDQLPKLTKLCDLNLSNVKFTKENSNKLFRIVFTSLQFLNNTNSKSAQTQLQIKNLYLSNTNVHLKSLPQTPKSSCAITELHLDQNTFDKKDQWQLSEFLNNTQSLKYLDVSASCKQSQYFALILKSILGNDKLQNFRLLANNNSLGKEISGKILDAFQNNKNSNSLIELRLNKNKFGAIGLSNILRACSLSNSLQKISVSMNILKGKDTLLLKEQFVNLFTNLKSLTDFQMSGKPNSKYWLGDKSQILFKDFPICNNLQVFDISSNKIGELAQQELSNLFPTKLPSLKYIYIDNNNWTLSSLKIFSKQISLNNSSNLLGNWPTNDADLLLSQCKKSMKKSIKKYLKKYKNDFSTTLNSNDNDNDNNNDNDNDDGNGIVNDNVNGNDNVNDNGDGEDNGIEI